MLGGPLNKAQRAELEHMGAKSVRLKIATYAGGHAGHFSMIGGFSSGDIRRDVIEDWLAEKTAEELKWREQESLQQAQTLLWAKIAACAGIIGAIIAIAALFKK